VAIVPVGLTDHRGTLPRIEPVTGEYARRVIEQVSRIQLDFSERWETPFVFLGDEFYILAGEPIPPEGHYREFPQIENGVGMVRSFLEEFDRELEAWDAPECRLKGTVATGLLFHPFLEASIRRLGLDLRTVRVGSRFWGSGINVAGLLTGGDFIEGLRNQIHGDFVLIPSEAMIGEEGLFLDDLVLSDVERELGVPVRRAGYTASEFVGIIRGLLTEVVSA